jgi:hypothetical protein
MTVCSYLLGSPLVQEAGCSGTQAAAAVCLLFLSLNSVLTVVTQTDECQSHNVNSKGFMSKTVEE